MKIKYLIAGATLTLLTGTAQADTANCVRMFGVGQGCSPLLQGNIGSAPTNFQPSDPELQFTQIQINGIEFLGATNADEAALSRSPYGVANTSANSVHVLLSIAGSVDEVMSDTYSRIFRDMALYYTVLPPSCNLVAVEETGSMSWSHQTRIKPDLGYARAGTGVDAHIRLYDDIWNGGGYDSQHKSFAELSCVLPAGASIIGATIQVQRGAMAGGGT